MKLMFAGNVVDTTGFSRAPLEEAVRKTTKSACDVCDIDDGEAHPYCNLGWDLAEVVAAMEAAKCRVTDKWEDEAREGGRASPMQVTEYSLLWQWADVTVHSYQNRRGDIWFDCSDDRLTPEECRAARDWVMEHGGSR